MLPSIARAKRTHRGAFTGKSPPNLLNVQQPQGCPRSFCPEEGEGLAKPIRLFIHMGRQRRKSVPPSFLAPGPVRAQRSEACWGLPAWPGTSRKENNS